MTKFRRRTLWTIAIFFAVLVLAALGARLGAGWYLGGTRFRHQITSALDHVLQADGTFMPLHYSDGTFYSDAFSARGKSGAFFTDLRAEQIRALVNWRGLLHHRWEVDELNVQNLQVRLGAPTPPAQTAVVRPKPAAPKKPSPWQLDLRQANIAQSVWSWGENKTAGEVRGAFSLRPNDGGWLIDAQSGTLSQTGWPSLTIASAQLRYAGDSLFVTASTLRSGDGTLGATGEIHFRRSADLQAHFEHIDVTPLLSPDWRARLHGNISGTAKIHAPLPAGARQIDGELQLSDGQLEALPLLDAIATFTHTEQFRRLTITRGSLSFSQTAGLTTVKNFVLESEGLLRIEGGATIAGGKINGQFQVGVTAASLQWLPGSQARVFTVAHDGYFWTPLRVSGSVGHPHEDLSRRLIAAAAGQLLQDSHDTLENTAKDLLNLIPH